MVATRCRFLMPTRQPELASHLACRQHRRKMLGRYPFTPFPYAVNGSSNFQRLRAVRYGEAVPIVSYAQCRHGHNLDVHMYAWLEFVATGRTFGLFHKTPLPIGAYAIGNTRL